MEKVSRFSEKLVEKLLGVYLRRSDFVGQEKGEEIPFGEKVLTVVCVWVFYSVDALTEDLAAAGEVSREDLTLEDPPPVLAEVLKGNIRLLSSMAVGFGVEESRAKKIMASVVDRVQGARLMRTLEGLSYTGGKKDDPRI